MSLCLILQLKANQTDSNFKKSIYWRNLAMNPKKGEMVMRHGHYGVCR